MKLAEKELHSLNLSAIQDKIIELKKEIIFIKIKKITQQNIKPHLLKNKKHLLAQLLTIETIKLNK
uniref:Ribosomal protein L29 n=1 Tax=Antithamnion hubbsii TaxID=1005974 RepID=A0A4D6WPN5_9FLOR|nr:ribosomal protein L29 [Antithamnion hubbsii]